jgi:nucleotide-binding universal stress UspA family protein
MFATPVLTDDVTTATAAAADAIAVAEEADVRATAKVVEGFAGDEILHAAELRDAELIVVGCRGHGAVASAFLGSVSRWLLSHSNIPVLVVKERAPVLAAAAR